MYLYDALTFFAFNWYANHIVLAVRRFCTYEANRYSHCSLECSWLDLCCHSRYKYRAHRYLLALINGEPG